MVKYKNVMEDVVEIKYQEIKSSLDCCHCERCHADILAYTLNHLPTKYVVTREGELYSKINLLGNQYKIDILSGLAKAARLVKQHPKH